MTSRTNVRLARREFLVETAPTGFQELPELLESRVFPEFCLFTKRKDGKDVGSVLLDPLDLLDTQVFRANREELENPDSKVRPADLETWDSPEILVIADLKGLLAEMEKPDHQDQKVFAAFRDRVENPEAWVKLALKGRQATQDPMETRVQWVNRARQDYQETWDLTDFLDSMVLRELT